MTIVHYCRHGVSIRQSQITHFVDEKVLWLNCEIYYIVIHPCLASSAKIRSSWYVCSVRTTSRCLFSACPPGTFGADCSLTCRCPADDVCDGITGLCQGGVCLYGWDGPACQLREWENIDLMGAHHWSPISLVPHLISPPSHWSPISLVPHLIGPPISTQAPPISLVPHLIGPPDSLVPHLIGPPSHWSPSHWSPNS